MGRKKTDAVRQSMYDKFNPRNRITKDNPNDTMFAMVERMYMRILTELCANRFTWTGLPNSVDVRFLELELFYRALAVFTFDERFDKELVLRGAGMGAPNMQDNPTAFTVIGSNYPSRIIPASKCVPIWANYLRTPDFDIVSVYAHRLAKLDMTVDINSDNTRTPVVLAVNENMQLSADNIMNAIRRGDNVIKMNAGVLNLEEALQPIALGGDANGIEKLHIVRTRLWNECMGLLGLDNANQDKKERLVADEVDANEEQVAMFKNIALNARRKAADEINEKYNLKVSVRYSNETNSLIEQFKASLGLGGPQSEEESGDDVNVDNDSGDDADKDKEK